MTERIKICGARTLPEKIIIEIAPSIFIGDEELVKDAKKIKKFLTSYLPVRTYEYFQKLLKE